MTGSLQKKGNVWYAVINQRNESGDRRLKWISTKKNKKSEAQKVLTELLSQMDKGNYIDPVKILFDEFMLDWLENTIKKQVEPTTWEGYCTNVKVHIIPYFKPKRVTLSELNPLMLQKYVDNKYKQGLSANYLKKHHANIKKALDFAVKMGILNHNPMENVSLPKIKKYDAVHYSLEQLEKLISITKGTIIESAVFLTIHYGFRRGEVLGLRWMDIDFAEGTLHICNTRTRVSTNIEKRPKTESSDRILPLFSRVSNYLLDLKQQQEEDKQAFGNCYKESDYVCRYKDGTPVNVNTINHYFKRILQQYEMHHIRLCFVK